MSEAVLSGLVERFRPSGLALCQRMAEEIRKLGFAGERSLPAFETAAYSLIKDSYTGVDGLVATWTNHYGHRIGGILFNGDGSYFAEFDVAEPHPSDRRWVVEGVSAWGRDGTVKAEPKLLAALE